ncbi:MAG: hypothetical protein Q8K65_05445 [Alphaproteobacteria bacterium]|nr:hypothetical protein [Alphaproteobacteria bacterium]
MTDPVQNVKPADALWQYWFALKSDARTAKWETLRHRLGQEPEHPLPPHPFVTEVFHSAANAGQTDIVETLFERGFKLDSETLAETVKRLALHYTAVAEGVLRVLVKDAAAQTDDAAITAAAKGRLDALVVLAAAGADVRAGNSGFFVALYSGQPAAMHYLYEKGAGLYHPAVIAAQYGRRGELPAEKAAIALGVYRDLVAQDNEAAGTLYKDAGGAPANIAALREKVADENGHLFTRLQLAVRAGQWDDIRRAAQGDTAQTLGADDFLTPDSKGLRAFDVLAAQGNMAALFDAAVWYRAPQEAAKLHSALADFRAEAAADLAAFTADMHRRELDDLAPPESFQLARRTPKR